VEAVTGPPAPLHARDRLGDELGERLGVGRLPLLRLRGGRFRAVGRGRAFRLGRGGRRGRAGGRRLRRGPTAARP